MSKIGLLDRYEMIQAVSRDPAVNTFTYCMAFIVEMFDERRGYSYCSQKYVADNVGRHRTTVNNALAQLVEKQYLVMKEGSGGGSVCYYVPNFEHPRYLERIDRKKRGAQDGEPVASTLHPLSRKHDTPCSVNTTPPVASTLHNLSHYHSHDPAHRARGNEKDGSTEPRGRAGTATPPSGGSRPARWKEEGKRAFDTAYDAFPHPPSCAKGNRVMAENTYMACLSRDVAPEQILEAMHANPPEDGEYMAQWINRAFPKASAEHTDEPQGKRTRTSKPKKPKDAPVKAEAAPVAAEQPQAPVAASSAADAPNPVTPAPKFEVGQTVKVKGVSDAFTPTVQSVKPAKGGKLVYHVKWARGDGVGGSADFNECDLQAA